MLKYLIIQLDNTSTSFCHYAVNRREPRLMPLDTLRKAIRWSMIENVNVQFLYPNCELPAEYAEAIETVDHVKIMPASVPNADCADILVFDGIDAVDADKLQSDMSIVVRTGKKAFFADYALLDGILPKVSRLNVVITDIATFTDDDFKAYEAALTRLSEAVKKEYVADHPVQFNLLTDRIMLKEMNNCGAGDESLTLAPNGRFYVCPAFFYDDEAESVGDIDNGPALKNQQLFKRDYAPICRICDAFQCHRCVWMNRRTTLEVNTPSHEQCVVAHIERNASRRLLESIREVGTFMPDRDIPEIDYLDPFEKVRTNK